MIIERKKKEERRAKFSVNNGQCIRLNQKNIIIQVHLDLGESEENETWYLGGFNQKLIFVNDKELEAISKPLKLTCSSTLHVDP